MKPYKPDQEKWNKFSKEIQLKHIATELSRATHASLYEQKDWEDGAYERAISLIYASLDDPKWEDKGFLYKLKDAVCALYAKERSSEISRFLYTQLMTMKV